MAGEQIWDTREDAIRELHKEGHPLIHERTTEHPMIKGVGQIAPAKHLLDDEGNVIGIYVGPKGVWRRRVEDDCVHDDPDFRKNSMIVTHDVHEVHLIPTVENGGRL